MLIDPRIEHVEETEDGGLMLDVVDGGGEVIQMYFLGTEAVQNFVEDVKLVLTGELNVKSESSSTSNAKRRCRNPIYPNETIH